MSMLCEMPPKTLPRVNSAILESITGLRPKMSARRPANRRTAALARPYAEPIQINLSPPFKSSVIVGKAVGMADKSKALRNIDTKMARKESQKAEPFLGAVSSPRLVVESVEAWFKVSGDMVPCLRGGGDGETTFIDAGTCYARAFLWAASYS